MVRALDFYLNRPGSNPTKVGNVFSCASFLCYDVHVVRTDPDETVSNEPSHQDLYSVPLYY